MEATENSQIEVFLTQDHVILSQGQSSLWCCKKSGELLLGSEFDPSHLDSTVSLGKVWGYIGKLRFFTDGEWKLLLITQAYCVGTLPQGGKVYCVDKIAIIPLTTDSSAEIVGIEVPEQSEVTSGLTSSLAVSAGVGLGVELSSMASGSIGHNLNTSMGRPASPTLKEKLLNFVSESDKPKELKDREKVEKRLTEALLWMFNDSRSFYFSMDFDLTQSLQRKTEGSALDIDVKLPFWQKVDERFFWNKWMLTDLLGDDYQSDFSGPWILPLIQGYVEIRQVAITSKQTPDILQPGWNARYAERRKRLNSDLDTSLKVPSDTTSVANEFADDPCVRPRAGSGSGYESGSENEGDGDSDVDRPSFKFNNFLKRMDQEQVEAGKKENVKSEVTNDEMNDIDHRQEKEEDNDQIVKARKNETMTATIVIEKSRDSVLEHKQLSSSPNTHDAVPSSPKDIPSLSTLCQTLLHVGPGDDYVDVDIISTRESLRVDRERLRPDSDMSIIDSDYFANSPSPCEDSEGWVAVRSEGGEDVEDALSPTFTLAIISRRSRHRAGTRYRRRGVDEDGHVANYVETEMLAHCGSHVVSYVLVRGSVPIYWTQPGYKYRPPPVIENSEEETQKAFLKHFDQQLDLYKELVVVNLVKQSGREKVLSDAYEEHILLMNNPLVSYIVFDFHQHYKINQSLGLKHLLKKTNDFTRNMKFCWIDTELSSSVLCKQESVFRVNCMDCLDRTNVIQSVFAKEVLQSALHKLGVIPFEERLEGSMLVSFQEMWGNNGDFISKQYTGTVAMKGDITRYGERKLSGLMKDGYNSAQRYYMNLFRDTYRQVLIDLMQGINPSEAFSSLPSSMRGTDELDDNVPVHTDLVQPPTAVVASRPANDFDGNAPISLREETLTDIIQHCKNELFTDKSLHLQAWALVEAPGYSFIETSQKEELCVLIQCRETSQLSFVSYSTEIDQIVCFMRIPMNKIQKIVIGPLGMYLRSSRRLHMRIYYSLLDDDSIYYLTLRTVTFNSTEEDKSILMGIADALSFLESDINVMEHKLTKKKSPPHEGIIYMVLPQSFVESLAVEQTHQNPVSEGDSDTQKHQDQKVTSLKPPPSDEYLSDSTDNEHQALSQAQGSPNQSNSLVPLNLRSHSCDDILSSLHNEAIRSPPPNRTLGIPVLMVSKTDVQSDSVSLESGAKSQLTVKSIHSVRSDSQLLKKDESVTQESDTICSETKNGSLKRSSSETSIASKVSSGQEKFSKFTGKLFQNLLSVGKSFKPRSSSPAEGSKVNSYTSFPTRSKPISETNEDSDTSISSQIVTPLAQTFSTMQQRFRGYSTSVPRFKVGVGWSKPPQTEPTEDEIKKQEMRARSKSKIVIV